MLLVDLTHELRSTLSRTTWAIDEVMRRDDLPPEERRALEVVRASNNMAWLEVLQASMLAELRLSPGSAVPHSQKATRAERLYLILRDIVRDFARSRDIEFRIGDAAVLAGLNVACGGLEFQVAMFAVLKNARMYSFTGTVTTIDFTRKCAVLEVTVCNAGLPITPEAVELCFQPGWRSSHAAASCPGRGYGLWVAKHVLLSQGARIGILPTDGAGLTRVTLFLPIDQARSSHDASGES
jgi:signal transduction histidine kinase